MVIFQFAKNLSLPEGIDAHPCGGMDGRSWRSLRSWGQGTQKRTTIQILKAGDALQLEPFRFELPKHQDGSMKAGESKSEC